MSVHYDAFISYRHMPLDSRIAKEIQNRLERESIPAAIRRQTGKKRISRVFRDKEELPITSDINDDITQALQNSDYLIVICSENTGSSIWVRREIEEFLKTHDISKVLTVLADGEPQDVIPEMLRYREEIVDGDVVRKEIEPLSCDFRSKARKVRRQEFPRLLAVILGCSYDDLRQRQRRRQLQRIIFSFITVLLVVSGIAVYALDRAHRIAQQAETIEQQAEQLRQEYERTLVTQSRYLAEVSDALLQKGDRKTAIQVALAALPDGSEDESRPVTTEALYALNCATYSYRQAKFNDFVPESADVLAETYRDAWLSPDGTCWLTRDYEDNLCFFDMETSKCFFALTAEDLERMSRDVLYDIEFLQENRVAFCFGSVVVCWDYREQAVLWTGNIQEAADPEGFLWWGEVEATYVAETDRLYLAINQGNDFCVCSVDCTDGMTDCLGWHSIEAGYVSEFCIAVSEDGSSVALGYTDEGEPPAASAVILMDGAGENIVTAELDCPNIEDIVWLAHDRAVVLTSDFDLYASSNLCSYSLACYRRFDGQTLWSRTEQQYIARNYDQYWEASGQLLPASLQVEDGKGKVEVIMMRFGDRVEAIDPENGKSITYAEFQASPITMHIGGSDRVFLTLRNGTIVQYVVDSDLVGEMGSVGTVLASAAYSEAYGKYALIKEDNKSIVFMGNQVSDTDGISIQYEGDVSQIYYAESENEEYRIVGNNTEEDSGRSRHQIHFYRIPELEPMAVGECFGSYIVDISVGQRETGDAAYWIYYDEAMWLCGWDLQNNSELCRFKISTEYISMEDMYCLPDGVVGIVCSEGILLADPETEQVRWIESLGFCYTATTNPDMTSFLMLEEVYEEVPCRVLRRIEYPSLEESILPDALSSSIAESSCYRLELAYSPEGTYVAFAAGEDYIVADAREYKIVQTIPEPCYNNSSIVFLSETVVALCGDSGRLQTWDISTGKMIMEDRFDVSSVSLYTGKGLLFLQEITGIGSSICHRYRVGEDGTFAREFYVEGGIQSLSGEEIMTMFNNEVVVYPTYSLDQLIDKAKSIVDGEKLTESDRIKYYIDG